MYDIKQDYTNPIDGCTALNKLIPAELALYLIMTLVFILNGNWIPALGYILFLSWKFNLWRNRNLFLDHGRMMDIKYVNLQFKMAIQKAILHALITIYIFVTYVFLFFNFLNLIFSKRLLWSGLITIFKDPILLILQARTRVP